jgi:hypothetical protein
MPFKSFLLNKYQIPTTKVTQERYFGGRLVLPSSLCVFVSVLLFSFVMYNVTEVAIICKTILPDLATRKMKVKAARILLYFWLLLDLSIYCDDF